MTPPSSPSPEATPIAPESAGALSAAIWDATFDRFARPLAILTFVGMILGRCVGPAPRTVLSQSWVARAEWLGGIATQGLLIVLVLTLMLGTLGLLRIQRLSAVLRFFIAGSSGILLAMAAAAENDRLQVPMAIILALVTGLTAVACGSAAMFAPHARAAGGIVSLAGTVVLFRHLGWWFCALGTDRSRTALRSLGQIVATLGWAVNSAIIAIVLVWLGARRIRHTTSLTAVILLIATLASWSVTRAGGSGNPPWLALLSRASYAVLGPGSALVLVPTAGQTFVSVLAILLVPLLLRARDQSSLVLAGMSLVLLSGAEGDVPLCAFTLCAASLLVLLSAHDSRRFWHRA